MKKLKKIIQQEMVLCIATMLAVVSMFFVPPDQTYLGYIDFRTLGILFSLMAIVAGLNQMQVFAWMAKKLLARVKSPCMLVMILVMLCFFLSMVITNDVALITFVPFAIVILQQLTGGSDTAWLIRLVVMQTIAANLGSMLTPIGNPQNLYLFEKSGMTVIQFMAVMLPYTIAAFGMLCVWILLAVRRTKTDWRLGETKVLGNRTEQLPQPERQGRTKHADQRKLLLYGLLFIVSLLVVSRVIRYEILVGMVVLYLLLDDREVFLHIDYALLGTFLALFVFIGNLGRITPFRILLERVVDGHEIITAICASQVMSNVPAAILLSGFTTQISKLMVGINLGGLGTLIASMASLISFKCIGKENPEIRGRYIQMFTLASVIVLLGLLAVAFVLQTSVSPWIRKRGFC